MKHFVIILAIIIVVLLGILIFVQPVKGPEAPSALAPAAPPAPSQPTKDIKIALPQSNQILNSSVIVSGDAVGPWFFEASFPVKVLDADGRVLGRGPVRAQGDWMTTGTVPFMATIKFSMPKYATGTVVFSKDNPSGLPSKDKSVSVPVCFSAPKLALPSQCHDETD